VSVWALFSSKFLLSICLIYMIIIYCIWSGRVLWQLLGRMLARTQIRVDMLTSVWPFTFNSQLNSVTYSRNSYSVEHIGEWYLFAVYYQIINRFFRCFNPLGLSYCFCLKMGGFFPLYNGTWNDSTCYVCGLYQHLFYISLIVRWMLEI
jgi:hypothetical protein